MPDQLPKFAELHAVSSFTFLRGASHPEELIQHARELGYSALALTDECSVTGIVRAHVAAKDSGFKLIVGSEFRLEDGLRLTLNADKGEYCLARADIEALAANCLALWLPDQHINHDAAPWFADIFPGNAWIAVELLQDGNDRERLSQLQAIGKQTGLPLVAANDSVGHYKTR